jgi:hypothetical protein
MYPLPGVVHDEATNTATATATDTTSRSAAVVRRAIMIKTEVNPGLPKPSTNDEVRSKFLNMIGIEAKLPAAASLTIQRDPSALLPSGMLLPASTTTAYPGEEGTIMMQLQSQQQLPPQTKHAFDASCWQLHTGHANPPRAAGAGAAHRSAVPCFTEALKYDRADDERYSPKRRKLVSPAGSSGSGGSSSSETSSLGSLDEDEDDSSSSSPTISSGGSSLASSNSNSSHSAMSTSSPPNALKKSKKKPKRSLAFRETVDVVPIPMRTEYSNRVKARMWSNASEIYQNAARNTIEFAAEGCVTVCVCVCAEVRALRCFVGLGCCCFVGASFLVQGPSVPSHVRLF